ncbi:hypothetical protein SF301_0597 [Shigella flexneri 2a str. 301]|uniref:Uncharacterized protein n=1 Tax=Shigella flexneri 2a str. 301 TaxID=198214 RepID=A0AB36PG31_SHIFL|nr:hypothetical protein SF301_0597 [Shigella flexneri 2a str. 301]
MCIYLNLMILIKIIRGFIRAALVLLIEIDGSMILFHVD